MSYTLRGRLESRLAASLLPVAVAGLLAVLLHRWWPIELAGLMVGVGLVLDALLYHHLLPYQPAWVALPAGLLELGAIMALVRVLGIGAPLGPALAFFTGSWLLAQIFAHAGFPRLSLSFAEDGGELGRLGVAATLAVAVLLAGAGGVAWGTRPPTVHLSAGVHSGPLLIDRAQTLEGVLGAVVRGGIVVRADDVTIRNVTVVGGEVGIYVEEAERVLLEDVRVSGFELDGIRVRRGEVTIRDCHVDAAGTEYGQGIDISFSADLEPSLVEGCTVVGGREGIVTNSAHVEVRGNRVSATTLRGITVMEMSMGSVEGNQITNGLGVGIYCGDYSECEISGNAVSGTRPDPDSGDLARMGIGVVAHFGAKARLSENAFVQNTQRTGAFSGATIRHE